MRGAKLEPSNPVLCRRFRLNANFGTRNFYFCGNFDLPAFFVRAELIKNFKMHRNFMRIEIKGALRSVS